MKKLLLLFSIIALFSIESFAQNNFRSIATGTWNNTLTWERDADGDFVYEESPASYTPTSTDGQILIQGAHTVTVSASVAADELTVNGSLNIHDGIGFVTITLTILNGTGIDLTNNGTITLADAFGFIGSSLVNNGAILNTGTITINNPLISSITMGANSSYDHSQNGGTIPTATWNTTSTCTVTGVSTTIPSGIGQTFGNLDWNCGSQSGGLSLALSGSSTVITGDFDISSTNGALFFLTTTETGVTVAINGSFNISNPSFVVFNNTGDITFNVDVDFSYSSLTPSFFASTGTATLNVKGNFSHTSGSLGLSGPGTGTINFNGTGAQSFTDGGSFSGIDFIVANSSIVDLGTSAVSGTGDLTVNANAELRIGSTHVDGAIQTGTSNGNIRVGGTRTYSSTSTIVYNGLAAQKIGNGFPSNVNLTVSNTSGISFSGILAINSVNALTISAGAFIDIGTNELQINGNISGSGSISGGSLSDLTIGGVGALGTLNFTTGSRELQNFVINRTASGTVTLGTDLEISATGTLTQTDGTFIINDQSLTILGDYARTLGSIQSNNGSTLTLQGSATYDALSFSGGSSVGTLTIDNVNGASTGSGLTIAATSGNLNLTSGVFGGAGSLTMGNGSTVTVISGSSTKSFATSGSYNVAYNNLLAINPGNELPTNATDLNNLTIGGDVTLDANDITINGDINLTNGTFNASSFNITMKGANWLANGGTFTSSANVTFDGGGITTLDGSTINSTQFQNLIVNIGTTVEAPDVNMNVSGTLTDNGTFDPNLGTITFSGTNQNIGGSLYNAIFDTGGTKTALTNLDVNGNLTINSGVILTVDAPSIDINVAGIWTNNGTYSPNDGTVIFDGGTQTINANGQSFFNLLLATSGGSVTKTLGSNLDVDGDLTISTDVTLDVSISNYAINLAGDWIDNGTFSGGTGTITFDGTSTISGSTITNFENVVISGILTAPSGNFVVSRDWTFSGTSFIDNGGTVVFDGSNQVITVAAGGNNFNDITFDGTSTKSLVGNLDIDGDLTLNDSNFTFDGGTATINIAGNWTSLGEGDFIHSGQVQFDGAAQNINAGATSTFNNVLLAGSGTKTLTGDIDVDGDLDIDQNLAAGTNNIEVGGDWDATDATPSTYYSSGANAVSFDGTGDLISNGATFSSVIFGGSGTTTMQDALDVDENITISSTLDNNFETINVGGNWDSSSGTFTSTTSTVTFDGTSGQTLDLGSGNNFNFLVIGGSGGITLANNTLDVDGNLTISSSLDVGSTNDMEIEGSWTNNGTFTGGTAKVTFDGNITQDVGGSGSTPFHDLEVTGTSNVEIESASSVSGTLILDGASSSFSADGSGGLGDFTLVSTDDSPVSDGNIAALPTPGNFTGDVTVDRYISTEGNMWRYIGSPVSGLFVSDWQAEFYITGDFVGEDDAGGANLPSLYYYDAGAEAWQQYPANPTDVNTATPITPGIGYSAFIRDGAGPYTDNTVSQEGPINKGSWDFTVGGNGGELQSTTSGWNLLGNPYPAALDWNLLYDDVSTAGVDGVASIRDNASGIFRGFDAFNNVPVNSGTRYIAIGQSFWVNSTSAPTLTATESMKVTDQSHSFYNLETPINYMRISLVQGADVDETLIFLYDDATPGKDIYDSYKRINDIFNLSTLLDDGSDMVVNAIGSANCDSEVALNITQADPGNYQLSFTEFESFVEDFNIMLKDNFIGSSISIKDNPIYPFQITADANSTGNGRFTVFFGSSQIDQSLAVASESESCIGNTVLVTVTDSQIGLDYQAYIDGNAVSDLIAGDGSIISLEAVTDGLSEGDYLIEVMAIKPGCSSLPLSQEAPVSLSEIPATVIVTDGSGCTGQSLTLSASGAPVDGYYNWYLTSESSEPIEEANEASFITPVLEVSRSYFVTAVNSEGCESVVRAEVIATVGTIDPVNEVSSEISCPGQSVTLTATGAPEDGFYRWYDSSESLIEGETGSIFTTSGLLESTDYFVSVVNSTSCESDKVSITAIISNEELNVEAEDALICGGGTVTLTASGAPEGDSYQWYDDSGNTLEGETGSELTRDVSETTSYSVQIISSTGCNSELMDVLAEVKEAPEKPEIIREDDILRSSITGPEYSYQWYRDSNEIPGEDGSKISLGNTEGAYQIEITIDGCPNISDIYIPEIVTSINEEFNSGELDLYPNPASDFIRLEFEGVESAKVSIYVIEMSGRIIQSEVLNNNAGRIDWQLDTKEYENGVYFVKLADGNRVLTGRFVKK